MKKSFLATFIILSFFACQNDAPGTEKGRQAKPDNETQLIVNIENLRLRDQAGEKGSVLERLAKGAVLSYLNELSNFTTEIKLGGIQFNEPWLKVETAGGRRGWVYGGGLHFEMEDSSQLAQLLMGIRLQTLFGQFIAGRIETYRRGFHNIQTQDDFAATYKAGLSLRDTLVQLLQFRIETGAPSEQPELFWLQQAIPAFIPQLVAEGTAYYLFIDYRSFLEKAILTAANDDDDFMQLCLSSFPEDSIEYFFPAWTIQTWDYGGHSLLGRGIHKNILDQIDKIGKNSDLFVKEINSIKSDLLNDISLPDVTYWETKDKIKEELDAIIAENYSALTALEKIEIQTRRQHFNDPEAYGIQVNHRSGIYDSE